MDLIEWLASTIPTDAEIRAAQSQEEDSDD